MKSLLQTIIEREQLRRACLPIRDHMAWFGQPMNDFSDEEIVQTMQNLHTAIRCIGCTVREANEAFKAFRM